MYAAGGRLGYEKTQSGYALCVFFLRHIWGGGRCYATPYYTPQTSFTIGTLCEMGAKLVGIYSLELTKLYLDFIIGGLIKTHFQDKILEKKFFSYFFVDRGVKIEYN
jgi:hypothetical protein